MESNIPTEFSFSGRKSVSFCDLNVSDYGKESMGILPPDFGKDSSDLMNFSHRESLGILQINALRDSLSFRRESLGFLNLQDLGRPSLDCGKESLGILHLKSPDVKFGDEDRKAPHILLSTVDENSTESYNILDTAFLQPTTFRKSSTLSSISNNPSFNSGSLEGPSRIYSVKSTKSDTDNFNNFSYFDSMVSSSIHSPLNKARIFSPSESNIRLRIHSMPVNLQDNFSPLHNVFASGVSVEKKIWSADRTRRFRPLETSFQESIDFRDTDPSIEFHDSVFIEGHVFAEKLADGSILNESFIGEVGTLDSTPQPNWPEDDSYLESKDKECQICDTENVFKTVDKMLPRPVTDIINAKLKTSKTDSTTSNDNEEQGNKSEENNSKLSQNGEKNVSKLLNLSDIQHEPKGMSNDPKDILKNLSQLLNSRNHSEKEKSKGKNLINSLADILCESKSNSKNQLDDSGHSSINEQVVDSPNKENHDFSEVLDLRMKSTEKETSRTKSCGDVALDLSVKSKRIEGLKDKRLSQSLGSASPTLKFGPQTEKNSSLDLNKNKTNNSSATSNDSRNISNLTRPQISGKLRQKSSNLKKGPMKAVLPVGDMKKKCNTSGTPEKNENVIATLQSKRTSTPINEPKLKPMAASTPTIQAAKDISRLSKNPRSSMESPSAKSKKINSSNHFTRERTSSFSSVVKSLNSARDLKKPNERVRSNSMDRKSVIRPACGKTTQNVSAPYQQKVENKPAFENRRKLGEMKHLPVSKSNNLESKSKETRMVTPNKSKHLGSSECSLKSDSSSSSSHAKNKTEPHCGKRNSVSESVRNKENPGKLRRNSITTVTGMMSSLSKIRKNMLDSPYFTLKKEESLDNDSAVLSENRRLGRSNSQPQLKEKTGKENIEI